MKICFLIKTIRWALEKCVLILEADIILTTVDGEQIWPLLRRATICIFKTSFESYSRIPVVIAFAHKAHISVCPWQIDLQEQSPFG